MLFACSKPKSPEVEAEHTSLIKKIEIIFAIQGPDSIKYASIKNLFQKENISLETYRTLYKSYTEIDPFKSLQLLQEIELLITRDMQNATRENQQSQNKLNN